MKIFYFLSVLAICAFAASCSEANQGANLTATNTVAINSSANTNTMAKTIELEITGMTCDHCVNAVTGALKDVDGVTDAVVNLDEKRATVTADDVDIAALLAAVEEEGYTAAAR